MQFYYDSSGKCIATVPEKVYQNSVNATTVFFIGAFPDKAAVTVAFTLPNKIPTPEYPMTGVRNLSGYVEETVNAEQLEKIEQTGFSVWSVTLPVEVTKYYGTVRMQFYVNLPTGAKIAVESTAFEVSKGVAFAVPDSTDPYEKILNEILTAIGTLKTEYGNLLFLNLENGEGTGSVRTVKYIDKNTGTGKYSATFGTNNITNDDHSLISGINNESVKGQGSVFIAGGNKNKVAGGLSSAIGHELRVNVNTDNKQTANSWRPKIAVGLANKDVKEAVFLIGNGTYDAEGNVSERKNAFEVLYDGRAKVQSEPVEETDVVRKVDLDTKIANLVGTAPDSLDTLQELAEWIQDDDSGAAKIVADVAELQNTKVDKINEPYSVYIINENGETTSVKFSSLAGSNCLVYKNLSGLFEVVAPQHPLNPANKQYVDTALENKIDKVTAATPRHQVYAKLADGTQEMVNMGHYNLNDAVARFAPASTAEVGSTDYGGTIAVSDPTQPYQAANKHYVDSNFLQLNKTDSWSVYTTGGTAGTQRMVRLDSNGSTANTIPQKTLYNTIKANGTPTEDNDLTPKKYVDNAIKKLYHHFCIVDLSAFSIRFSFYSSEKLGEMWDNIDFSVLYSHLLAEYYICLNWNDATAKYFYMQQGTDGSVTFCFPDYNYEEFAPSSGVYVNVIEV